MQQLHTDKIALTAALCQLKVMSSIHGVCAPQALQEMRKLRTEKTAEVKEFRLQLEHLKTHKDHSTKLKSEIAGGQEKDRNYMSQINELDQQAKVGVLHLPAAVTQQCCKTVNVADLWCGLVHCQAFSLSLKVLAERACAVSQKSVSLHAKESCKGTWVCVCQHCTGRQMWRVQAIVNVLCCWNLALTAGSMLQAYQQTLDEMNVKLTAIADYGDELKQLKTRHEMTAKQNADAFVKLQVTSECCERAALCRVTAWAHVCSSLCLHQLVCLPACMQTSLIACQPVTPTQE